MQPEWILSHPYSCSTANNVWFHLDLQTTGTLYDATLWTLDPGKTNTFKLHLPHCTLLCSRIGKQKKTRSNTNVVYIPSEFYVCNALTIGWISGQPATKMSWLNREFTKCGNRVINKRCSCRQLASCNLHHGHVWYSL